MSTPSDKLRDRWLDTLLPEVARTGWTLGAMRRSAESAELSEGERALAAPNGLSDLIDHFFERASDQMLVALAQLDLDALRTHERVAAGLRAWLSALEPNKLAVRKAAGRGLTPWGTGGAVKRLWRISDAIWEAAGDAATDYNRHTKRALLSAVIPSIVLRWLDSDDPDEIEVLIERRLQQAMTVGKTGGKFAAPFLDFAEKVSARVKARDL